MKKTKTQFAVLLGTLVEWLDFGMYGYMAPIIAREFFPSEQALTGLLQAFMVFALGYLMRPLGAIAFGRIGDKVGRVKALQWSIFFIAVPSILLAFLPSYHSVGVIAPLSLIFLRAVQGLCMGGEFAGSMVYLVEMAPSRRRGFTASLANNASNVGIGVGLGLAVLVSALVGEAVFQAWGWRIPFLIGGLLGVTAWGLRRWFVESSVYTHLQAQQQVVARPLKEVWQHQRAAMLTVFLMMCCGASCDYALLVYLTTYLHQFMHFSMQHAMWVQWLCLCLTLFFVPLAGMLSDKLGRRTTLVIAALGVIGFAIPAFHAVRLAESAVGVVLAVLPLLLCFSLEQGTTPAAIVEHFPAKARYTGVALGYNLGYAVFGGMAPLIMTWLMQFDSQHMVPAYYLMAASVVTLVVVLSRISVAHGKQVDLYQ